MSLYTFLSKSQHPMARIVRALYRFVTHFSLPAPRAIVRPVLWMFVTCRTAYYFLMRVLVCEPLFKARCTRYGRNLRTDAYIHWVSGIGDLICGDDVLFDGKCSIV